MKIFIGSSSEQSKTMETVAGWLHKAGHEPYCWNKAILPGQDTLINQLIRISQEVDGAIFIFAEDDSIDGGGEGRLQPRDNVIFEYGLFMGTLGAESVVFIRVGKAKIATDLLGIVYIDLPNPSSDKTPAKKVRSAPAKSESNARTLIESWAKGLIPFYLRGLGNDLGQHLVNELGKGYSVRKILTEKAPSLVKGNVSNEIRALCSDKGEHSEEYYGPQFEWVKKVTKRRIKRVFVRSQDDDDSQTVVCVQLFCDLRLG